MDSRQLSPDDYGGPWTDERHSAFLDSLEECFVRRMLSGGAAASQWSNVQLPLDRYLPDSATESTRDLRRANQPKKRPPVSRPTSPAPDEEEEQEESGITSERRRRRRRSTRLPSDATLHKVQDANDHKESVEATMECSCS